VEKVIFAAFAPGGAPPASSTAAVECNNALVRVLHAERFPGLALQIEDHDITRSWQRGRPTPSQRVVACLSVWTSCSDEVGEAEAVFAEFFEDFAGYLVTEAVPRAASDHGTSLSASRPGVILTSLLYRARSMTHDEFVDYWQLVHQPMSLRIHPQRAYVRNVVARTLTSDAPGIDGVCEEGFASTADILDNSRFYGADVDITTWQQNRTTIGEDVPLFLDTARTTSTIMREYRLRAVRA
jgi:hypothetical protein